MPGEVQGLDMSRLYLSYPVLNAVETKVHHRLAARSNIVSLFKKGAIGAELGVFTGVFSEYVMNVAKPKKYYMVDPWHVAYGEFFPAWGPYTEFGKLSTKAALAAAEARAQSCSCGEIIISHSLPWLRGLPDGHLDWIYLDSSHQYEATFQELVAAAGKLSPDGEIFGDDAWTERGNKHYGVFQAITDFCRSNDFEMFRLDHAAQWAIRRMR